jgi:hypothetical protein
MPDLEMQCAACQETFLFTEAEQAHCEANAFSPPTFCPNCYLTRKTAKDEARDKQRRGSHRRRH